MGWSCTAAAANAYERLSRACREQTGSQNTWQDGRGQGFFLETSRVEHGDGAITGAVWKMLPNGYARRAGQFRIDGDGTMARVPASLKRLVQ